VQVEERGRSEPRLTVPTICLGFIADSLFSATLIGLCRTKGPLSGLPRMTRREKVVARMPQSSFRKGSSNRFAEHWPPRPHVPREIARSIEILLMSESLSGFTGRARTRNAPYRRRSGSRSRAYRFLGERAA
jgi:hypothetical protein